MRVCFFFGGGPIKISYSFQRMNNNGADQAALMHKLVCTCSLATKRDFLATNLTIYMCGNLILRPAVSSLYPLGTKDSYIASSPWMLNKLQIDLN